MKKGTRQPQAKSFSGIKKITIYCVTLLLLAAVFLAIIKIKKSAIQEIEENVELCTGLAKNTALSERYNFVEECRLYLGNTCTSNEQCGPFPCMNKTCLIKPCGSDRECPSEKCGNDRIKDFCAR